MKQIELKIAAKSKDILNKMLIERDGLGYTFIIKCIDKIIYQINNVSFINDEKLKNKIIRLLVEAKKEDIMSSKLPEDTKSHLCSLISSIGKTYNRENTPQYLIIEKNTLIRNNNKLFNSLNGALKKAERLSILNGKIYEVITLENYKKLKYLNDKDNIPFGVYGFKHEYKR